MSEPVPIIALMYDFDKTLCTRNMQEYSFIPNLGMQADAFWREAADLAACERMDNILAYMYWMIRKSAAAGQSIRRADFERLGRDIDFFPGVVGWFARIRAYAQAQGALAEHYIISSGLREIIDGTVIAHEFREIFASEFLYDKQGAAIWPKIAVNYTGKTQFLFRINKDVLDVSQDEPINRAIPENERRVPFRNMIYIGDGLTDVPCMKLVKTNGGCSIAVYPDGQKDRAADLVHDDRVNFISPANYEAGGELDRLVKLVIDGMIIEDRLVRRGATV